MATSEDRPPEPAAGGRALRRWAWGILPLVLLAVLVGVFLRVGVRGVFQTAVPPVEELAIERVVLRPGTIVIHLVNSGPQPVTVSQALVDEAYWQFTISPDATIPRLGRATVTLAYPWVEGESHRLRVLSSTGVVFERTIEVATPTPTPDARYLTTFTLLGTYVGVVPVALGLLWLPFLRELPERWMGFFLSLTAGLLLFLGADAVAEALDLAASVPSAFQGVGLVLLGVVGAAVILAAVGRRVAGEGLSRRLALATFVALGIGLHNLGEGLAIGAAYGAGKVALGTFLILGFAVHNTTEGLAIVAPVSRDPLRLRTLAWWGALAGAPTIAGAWVGGLAYSPVLGTLFLAVGAGAIFQVVYEIIRLMGGGRASAGYQVAGFVAGLLVMYFTGLLVAV
ncbi:MAG: ZIP family metal transporter [Armatimonadota bacterium]|nr:ZIP family metal transporter [Armatimonadota bacterium]